MKESSTWSKSDSALSGLFDFVMAFTGNAILSAQARAFVSAMTRALAVDNPVESNQGKHPTLWAAFTRAIRCAPAVLESSPIVFAFKERWCERAACRQVALHMPPFNAWGVSFRTCGGGCKDVLPSDLTFRYDKNALRCHCALCHWKSWRVKYDDVDDLVFPLCPDLPLAFWHTYPPSPHLLDSFARVTRGGRK